ncbi:alanine racemase [Desulfonispora thiosulfatigenes DSM 11270]|uniref:Alanine racemase n=2 Tax=Desulfonispora thiosulfatigenes TaxID=83661 RepID=A0A1W1UZ15_DESTI|nr:alanine racemase [Desulfonispora thiosulfatigenes DSM 11270]
MDKWVEVNLDKIANNFLEVRNFVADETKILGVVKADAYGHGIIESSRELQRQGIDYLGVTEVSEGIKLRRAGIFVPILIFSSCLEEELEYTKRYNLTITLNNLELIQFIVGKQIELKVHLKVETGLGRTGIKVGQLPEIIDILKENPQIEVEGLYTHLATAMWREKSFVDKQFSEFNKAIKLLTEKGVSIPLKHICNSSALVKYPKMHLDMVRAGTILYGQDEGGQVFSGKMQDPWSLKAKVIYLNQLEKGHSVGYERIYVLKRKSKIAVVAIGFYHGFSVEPIAHPKKILDLTKILAKTFLRFINHPRMKTYGYIKGKRVPVVGKVGMQLTMLDVTDVVDIQIGDIVELTARRTNLSTLIPKLYIKENEIISQSSYEEISTLEVQ